MAAVKTLGRAETLDKVATTLLGRTARLSRVILRRGSGELSRSEIGVLSTLESGAHRISDLVNSEAMAQPSVSRLIDKLESRGLVARIRDAEDGRVVWVSLSADGRRILLATRGRLQADFRQVLTELDDRELATLAAAGDVIERVIDILQRPAR